MNFILRIRALFQKRRLEAEMAEEMRLHLEQRTREHGAGGMTPEEAWYAARREFGHADGFQEACREAQISAWVDGFLRDLRHGFRSLMRTPGFTAVALATLALGIGAATAMFSLVNAVLFRPLPFHDPGRLTWVQSNHPGATLSERTLRVDNFLDYRAQATSFEALAAYSPFFELRRYSLTGVGDSQRLRGVQVSQNFLEVLGVPLLLGRNFVAEEAAWNGRRAAILSHAFWQQKFAGAPDVVGRSVTINGQPVEIVGVLPASANLDAVVSPGTRVELLLPLPLTPEMFRTGSVVFGIGRLSSAATVARAREELEALNVRLRELNPERVRQNGQFGANVTSLEDHVRKPFRPAFLTLLGAVLCVLLIACVNLSNLLLARAHARSHEFSVRLALGASRWHLVRQTLVESLLLAFAGGAMGMFLAWFVTASLRSLQVFNVPLLQTAAMDLAACALAVVLTTVAGFVCGVLPAWQLGRRERGGTPSAAAGRGSADRRANRVRQSLVIAEIALASILLVGAGLLLRSFVSVLRVDLGFQPAQTLALRVDTPRAFGSYAERVLYYDRLVERVSAVPGIETVGLSDTLPLGDRRAWAVRAAGVTYEPGSVPDAFVRIVDQGGMQTLGIPLRAGRYFDGHDAEASPKVMLVNETMARKMWPGLDPLGRTALVSGNRNSEYTVVGVVADVPHGLEQAPQSDMYLNFRQSNDWQSPQLLIRSGRAPAGLVPEVRSAVKEFDPALATNEFTLLEQIVDQALAPRRLIAGILGLFSTLALLLAGIGLYGVIAYSVSQRTREIGIRLAIGAQRGDVLRLVVGEGMRLAGIGLAAGLGGALLVTRVLQSQLHGITASDPLTYGLITVLLGAVAGIACLVPARRAAQVDPMVALRAE